MATKAPTMAPTEPVADVLCVENFSMIISMMSIFMMGYGIFMRDIGHQIQECSILEYI